MAENFEYLDEYRYPTSILLNLTDDCNCCCRYCFVEQNPHYMSEKVALDAVDFLMDSLNKSPRKDDGRITFFGGEPTLCWDLIEKVIFYVEEKYPERNIEFDMTTNGTLLTKERIKFLNDHKVGLLLSIDGDEKTHNYNRPLRNGGNCFQEVYKNIPELLKYYPKLTFRSTVTPDSVDELFNNYVFAFGLGFKNYFVMPNAREYWDEKSKEKLKAELSKIYLYMMAGFLDNKMPMLNFSTINQNFRNVLIRDLRVLSGKGKEETRTIRCGLGHPSVSIGYDGKIYGCQEQTSQGEKSVFHIGNIYSGIDVEAHKKLIQRYAKRYITNEKSCETCNMKEACSDITCPSSSYDLFGDPTISPEIACLWVQWGFDFSVILMDFFVKEDNKIFEEYLDTFCNFNDFFKEGGK